MSNDLRKQLKATPVSAIKKQEKEVNNTKYQNDREKDNWLKIENGSNKIRIFPAHKESTTFYYPFSKWWLLREITKEVDGEEVVKIEKRPVWNAKIHGGSKKDIVEEFVKFTKNILREEITDDAEYKIAEEKLTHWKTGLTCKHDWVCYANKYNGTSKDFGLLTFSNAVRNKINELAISDDSADNIISTDPFTDPDEGKAIVITYNEKETIPSNKYKATIEFRGNYSLEDKEIEDFMKLESLAKKFTNVYKKRDFDLALQGLQLFDSENGYGIFELPEWLSIVEELQKEWPEEKEQDEIEKVTSNLERRAESMPNEEEDDVETETLTDELSSLDRDGLKKYIASNNLSFIVKKSMNDDDIRNGIRLEESNSHPESVSSASKTEAIADVRARLSSITTK